MRKNVPEVFTPFLLEPPGTLCTGVHVPSSGTLILTFELFIESFHQHINKTKTNQRYSDQT